MEDPKKYPSWILTKTIRVPITLVAWLKSKAAHGESLGSVVERLLKKQMNKEKVR